MSVQKSASSVPNSARRKAGDNHPRRRGGSCHQQVCQTNRNTWLTPNNLGSKSCEKKKRLLILSPSHRPQEQVGPTPDPETELSQGLSRLGYAPTSDTVAFTRNALHLHPSDRGKKANSVHVNKALESILPKTYTGTFPTFSPTRLKSALIW